MHEERTHLSPVPSVRRDVASVLMMTLVALGGVPAFAQVDPRLTPGQERILINKNVAGLRWAIAFDPDEGVITGNVFSPEGGVPQFVWCETVDQSPDELTFDCQGTDACENWAPLGLATLPRSFLEPASSRQVASSHRERGAQSGQGATPSTSRYTPDGSALLISKDVDGDRWAITLLRDGTVFGNVFSGANRAPTFLSCEQRDQTEEETTLECAVATLNDWASLGEVVVPTAFFGSRCPGTRSPPPLEDPCLDFPPAPKPARVYEPVDPALDGYNAELRIEQFPVANTVDGHAVYRQSVTLDLGLLPAATVDICRRTREDKQNGA